MFEFIWFALAIAVGMIIASVGITVLYVFAMVKFGKKIMEKMMKIME